MKGLLTFTRLEPAHRALVSRTLVLVAATRVALWLLPVRRVQELIGDGSWVPFSVRADLPNYRLVWAVQAASKRVPRATCLTQSLALHCLLTRAGRPSQVHIGVKKDAGTGFQSHAWVEYEGGPLLSTPAEVLAYSRVLSLQDRAV